MTPTRNRKYKIKINPYGAELTVILSSNPDRTAHKLEQNDKKVSQVNPVTLNDFFIYDNPDSKEYFLVFPLMPNADSIAHEAFHVVRKLLFTSDVKLTNASEESWAYLMGWVVGEITDKVTKANKRRKA